MSALLVVAGLAFGYLSSVGNTSACPGVSSSVPLSLLNSDFVVEVSFKGSWNATVQTYSALDRSPSQLRTTCHYLGSGDGFILVAPWNPSGEQTVAVAANKLDSGGGNLTASVGFGAGSRSNSTTLPYGSTTAYVSTAP
jgi:hypothetical protein